MIEWTQYLSESTGFVSSVFTTANKDALHKYNCSTRIFKTKYQNYVVIIFKPAVGLYDNCSFQLP